MIAIGRTGVLVLMVLALAGCKKKEEPKTEDKAKGKGKGKVEDKAKPDPVADKAPPDAAAADPVAPKAAAADPADVAGRAVEVKFLRFEGSGPDKKSWFAVKNLTDRAVTSVQTYEFYYDASGKALKSYPSSFGDTIAPGETKEMDLGEDGEEELSKYATIEAEASEVVFDDESEWINMNLLGDTNENDRPLGGFTDEQLKASSGRKVTAKASSAVTDVAMWSLTSAADKDIKELGVRIYYYDEAGEVVTTSPTTVTAELKAGTTVEVEAGLPKDMVNPEAKTWEMDVYQVTYADDTIWLNRNLESINKRARTQ